MNRWLCFVTALLTLPLPSAAAAVTSRDWKTPGDGLLTYDDVNRREWLDLSQTLLSDQVSGLDREAKYQHVAAQTGLGGQFAGFRVAQSRDAIQLAQSAGIDTGTRDRAINQLPVDRLGTLMGFTVGGQPGTRVAIGLLDEVVTIRERISASFFVFPTSGANGQAGLLINPLHLEFASPPGVLLYRQVPEPSTLLMVVTCLLLKRGLM